MKGFRAQRRTTQRDSEPTSWLDAGVREPSGHAPRLEEQRLLVHRQNVQLNAFLGYIANELYGEGAQGQRLMRQIEISDHSPVASVLGLRKSTPVHKVQFHSRSFCALPRHACTTYW